MLNRDGLRHLEACLSSVLAEAPARVLLVDNASSDGSAEFVAGRFPQVEVLRSPRNLGFAAGNNMALRVVRTPYAMLLNNDTRVRPGCLAALGAAMESDPSVAAVQAKLVFADRPEVVQSAGTLLLSDGSAGDRGSAEPDDGRFSQREEVFAACGAAAVYRMEALRDCGFLDESFFMYYEDTDLCWRLRLRGWKVLFEPGAIVEHVHAGSSGSGSSLMRFHADRNRLLMVLKNAPLSFVWGSYTSLGRRAGGAGPAAGHARGRVLASFLAHAPGALMRRVRIRARRKVADAEILRWAMPRDDWDARC